MVVVRGVCINEDGGLTEVGFDWRREIDEESNLAGLLQVDWRHEIDEGSSSAGLLRALPAGVFFPQEPEPVWEPKVEEIASGVEILTDDQQQYIILVLVTKGRMLKQGRKLKRNHLAEGWTAEHMARHAMQFIFGPVVVLRHPLHPRSSATEGQDTSAKEVLESLFETQTTKAVQAGMSIKEVLELTRQQLGVPIQKLCCKDGKMTAQFQAWS
ncbi:unnamed protein product [Symbiodinium natans]|uniref:Uncharacterized protein n=1 Tax=Symbiodinium natans TaxID=878477 RepID=A0A812JXW3_9DINO|nr:unnamed protein product [Symbiodinium natans]